MHIHWYHMMTSDPRLHSTVLQPCWSTDSRSDASGQITWTLLGGITMEIGFDAPNSWGVLFLTDSVIPITGQAHKLSEHSQHYFVVTQREKCALQRKLISGQFQLHIHPQTVLFTIDTSLKALGGTEQAAACMKISHFPSAPNKDWSSSKRKNRY